jgi:nicotinate-nucleotide adenylyltransferase
MRIGLFFGSFNPIHHGHLIIAQHVINRDLADQVWFVISPQNPLKKVNTLLNENFRKHLIDLAINDEGKLITSDVEFKLPRPSFTIDTLHHLKEIFPLHSFEIIMGNDSFSDLDKWKNFEAMIKENRFLIYPRKNFELKNKLHARILKLEAPEIEISSTHIREMIKEGLSIDYLVPEKVKEEIERKSYYK